MHGQKNIKPQRVVVPSDDDDDDYDRYVGPWFKA